MKPLKLLDLFSGIGGFSLGLERTGGFETVAFSEIEPFPCKILNKHWPEVPNYGDIRNLTASRLRDDGISVDAICGGFPCQDISTAGKGAGIEGERSGLWSEYARLIGELRPKVVFVENVAALLGRGLGRVLGDLASIGYDAEWHCIPASAIGAPHRRDRVWIIAHPRSEQHQGDSFEVCRPGAAKLPETIADSSPMLGFAQFGQESNGDTQCAGVLANPEGISIRTGLCANEPRGGGRGRSCDSGSPQDQWAAEPDLGRVAYGVSDRVDRLKGLGNAVVPQIPQLLGQAYLQSIGWRQAA